MNGSWHRYRPGERVAPAAGARPARPRGARARSPSASTPRSSSCSSAGRGAPSVARPARAGPARTRLRRRRGASPAARSGAGRDGDRRGAPRPAGAGRDRQRLQERDPLDRAGLAVRAGRATSTTRRSTRLVATARRLLVANAAADARPGAGDDRRRPRRPGSALRLRPDRPAVPPLPDRRSSRSARAATCRGPPTGARPAREPPTDDRRGRCARAADDRGRCDVMRGRCDGPMTTARRRLPRPTVTDSRIRRPRPARLVRETFAFLLEREPSESILPTLRPAGHRPLLPRVRRRDPPPHGSTGRIASSRDMCEHFIARAAEPFRLDELWPFAERLERFGIAGFGWGAAWLDGRRHASRSYRDVRAFRDDPGRERGRGDRDDRRALVHLRRPSRLSTLTLPDTQPFDDPAGRFAFSHNGDLRDYRRLRDDATGRRAGSTAAPTPRSGPAGSRTPGTRRAGRRTCSARSTTGSAARRTSRSWPPTATPYHYAGQRREPGLLVPRSGGSGSSRPGSTRSIGRSSGSSRPARRSAGSSPLHATVAAGPRRDARYPRRRMRQPGASQVRRRAVIGRDATRPRGATDAQPERPRVQRPDVDGRPTALAADPRARPDLALLARAVVDLRRARRDHDRPARVHGPRRPTDRRRVATLFLVHDQSARSSRSSSSRRSARSPTTRCRAGAGASRTSSSARCSTSSS